MTAGRETTSLADPELLQESVEDLYENAPCGYLSALPDGTLVKLNRTFLTWTGYRREDLVGRKRFQDLLPPGGRIFYETHLAPLLRMQGAIKEIAVEIVCADGRRLPALINTVLRKDAQGNPLLSRTTVFDASDRREYERELVRQRQKAEQADRAKAAFISTVSHEIRNPVNAILGITYLLGNTGTLSPDQEKLVHLLRRSSDTLMNLINNILDVSKLEAGKSSLEERPFDLRHLIDGIVQPLQMEAAGKGLALRAEIDERLPAGLLGDPVKIGQVLTNLLGNAVKFTAQGSVTLTLRVPEQDAEAVTVDFRIADTGIGISADQLPLIFDEFRQANSDIGPKYGGTGLGLAISQKLVELHGGRIEVESEAGRGTAFTFTLRLRPDDREASEAAPGELVASRL